MSTFLTCVAAGGALVRADLSTMLGPAGRDLARVETNQWIKRLRLVRYGDSTMRGAFLYRGESLWWFTELYLQKMRRLDAAVATVLALDAAREVHEPTRIRIESDDVAVREAAAAFGRARGLTLEVSGAAARTTNHRWPSYLVGLTASLPRWRPNASATRRERARVAAYVHTAFWRGAAATEGPQQESYIGAVLDALAERVSPGDVACVGLGPQRNFRTRRWWDPLAPASGQPLVTPIEQLAPRSALAESRALWRRRGDLARAVTHGPEIRAAAVFRECDLWAVLEPELRATALVQWTWSARAMDEAHASIERLSPEVVLTYAEAGGWGRALMLAARAQQVPTVGVQHGFIYRHWLNYLHEPDELQPQAHTRGFPCPDRTLVFDDYAAEHLCTHAHLPPDSLIVTGSARLDELWASVRRMHADEADDSGTRRALRQRLGVPKAGTLAVLASKFSEIKDELPALFRAVAAQPQARLVIKPHPAEPAALYATLSANTEHVTIAPADIDLAQLLSVADAIVTMNSTVAIDGLVLGIPALTIGLPNNLTPFVDKGVMAGANGAEIGPALGAVLSDEGARGELIARGATFAARYGMRADGHAAERAADAILAASGASPGVTRSANRP